MHTTEHVCNSSTSRRCSATQAAPHDSEHEKGLLESAQNVCKSLHCMCGLIGFFALEPTESEICVGKACATQCPSSAIIIVNRTPQAHISHTSVEARQLINLILRAMSMNINILHLRNFALYFHNYRFKSFHE